MFSEESPSIICCLYTAIIILFSCELAYLTFGIIYLIEDYIISKECTESNLWVYVLVSLILSTFSVNIKSNNEDKKTTALICSVIFLALINVSMTIWGGLELMSYSKSCKQLFESNLWNVGLTSFVVQLFVSFISTIGFMCVFYYFNTIETRNTINIQQNDVNIQINNGENIQVYTLENLK